MGASIGTLTVMRGESELLASLLPGLSWAAERHVVETADDPTATRRVCGDAHVHHHPLPVEASFEDARAVALPQVATDWVLVVDTDETIGPVLAALLCDRVAEWSDQGFTGVWLPRRNVVLGTPLRYSSAWPDYQLRLFRTDSVSYTARLHAPAQVPGPTHRVEPRPEWAIEHHPFLSTHQYVDKLNRYSSLEARQHVGPDRTSPARAAAHAGRDFLARYLKMRGYRDGAVGLHYCLTMAAYRYLSEVKVWEQRLTDGGRR
jgi:hypothetical protein